MIIAGLTAGKYASVCLIRDGVIELFLEEERLSRKKRDDNPFLCLIELKKHVDKLDYLAISESNIRIEQFVLFAKKLGLIDSDLQVLTNTQPLETHHTFHAASGFYTSGFTEAVCVVIDNAGSQLNHNEIIGAEAESILKFKYPATCDIIYKKITNSLNNDPQVVGPYDIVGYYGIGKLYSALSHQLGFGGDGAGKAMGLSSYGKHDSTIPDIMVSSAGRMVPNRNLFYSRQDSSYTTKYPYMTTPVISDGSSYNKENLSYAIQKATQDIALEHVLNAVKLSGCKNVVISGGYGMNCVANYEFLKHLPSDVRVYVDPIAYDGGQSLGIAKYFYHKLSQSSKITKQDSYYLGPSPSYDFSLGNDEMIQDVDYADIVKLLCDQNIVAMYQGKSESGLRALGNRTILFDPRNPNGKDIVNTVKRREAFRPFAGTVLLEESRDWFDMRTLDESPFMTFAVNVKQDKKSLIPSIVHVDGSCRIQTVSQKQNYHYYNLINEFHKYTGVPILFNTSFNLAGDPLVETIEDALETLRRSDIDYLYLPEQGKLITIKAKYDNKTL